jgi:hypothetical protein
MKNIMKKLVVLGLLVLSCVAAQAQTPTTFTTNLSAGTSLVLAFPVNLTSVTVVGTASGATTVSLYDNNAATLTFTNAAYTSAITYATNITSIITNSLGALQTNTFTGYYTTTATTAANTNNLPTVGVFSAGTSASVTTTVNLNTTRGIAVSASTNATLSLTYRRLN